MMKMINVIVGFIGGNILLILFDKLKGFDYLKKGMLK
jgi:hypothetical protein